MSRQQPPQLLSAHRVVPLAWHVGRGSRRAELLLAAVASATSSPLFDHHRRDDEAGLELALWRSLVAKRGSRTGPERTRCQ